MSSDLEVSNFLSHWRQPKIFSYQRSVHRYACSIESSRFISKSQIWIFHNIRAFAYLRYSTNVTINHFDAANLVPCPTITSKYFPCNFLFPFFYFFSLNGIRSYLLFVVRQDLIFIVLMKCWDTKAINASVAKISRKIYFIKNVLMKIRMAPMGKHSNLCFFYSRLTYIFEWTITRSKLNNLMSLECSLHDILSRFSLFLWHKWTSRCWVTAKQ